MWRRLTIVAATARRRLAMAALLALAAMMLCAPSALAACPPGQIYIPPPNAGAPGRCSVCKVGTIPDPSQTKCVLGCSPGSQLVPISPAQKGCAPCAAGQISAGGTATCQACVGDTTSNAAHTKCVCAAPGSITGPLGGCTPCPSQQVPNKDHTSCAACPAGTKYEFGSCTPNQTSGKPAPGLLETTPGFAPQAPAGAGTPRGGGAAPPLR